MTKIVCISDTHSRHNQLENIPDGDILIHAGDMTMRGEINSIKNFLEWYSKLPHKYKVLIAGNHDFLFERDPELIKEIMPDNIIYLNDSGCQINDLNIWGSPVQPWFHNWAFNRSRGADIKKHWDLIPDNTDILITHGPMMGVLDITEEGDLTGCQDLLERVKVVKPKLHVCGHIHEAYGQKYMDTTLCFNASVLNRMYMLVNDPLTTEL